MLTTSSSSSNFNPFRYRAGRLGSTLSTDLSSALHIISCCRFSLFTLQEFVRTTRPRASSGPGFRPLLVRASTLHRTWLARNKMYNFLSLLAFVHIIEYSGNGGSDIPRPVVRMAPSLSGSANKYHWLMSTLLSRMITPLSLPVSCNSSCSDVRRRTARRMPQSTLQRELHVFWWDCHIGALFGDLRQQVQKCTQRRGRRSGRTRTPNYKK